MSSGHGLVDVASGLHVVRLLYAAVGIFAGIFGALVSMISLSVGSRGFANSCGFESR